MNSFKPINDIFKNWNKDMYIATKKDVVEVDDYNNEVVEYNKPFYFGRVNYQALTPKELEAYMQEYGETNNKVVGVLIRYTEQHKLNTFDIAYLYDATPKGETNYGDNANFIVRAFKPQNTRTLVILEERIK